MIIPKITPKIAHGHMAAPALLNTVNYNNFRKTKQERDEILTAKENNKEARKKYYGKDAHKHLNVPHDIVNIWNQKEGIFKHIKKQKS